MHRHDPLPVSGASEVVLLCSDRQELEACAEFYCGKLGFPLVTAWKEREESNYGERIENLEDIAVEEIKGKHEMWVKAGTTLIGLWLPQEIPAEAERPPSRWEDVWDRGGEHVHYALEVDTPTIEAITAELERRDVDFKLVRHSQYGGARSAFVRDPAGHVLEFAERQLREEVEAEMPSTEAPDAEP